MSKIVEVSGYDPFDWQEPVDVTLHISGIPGKQGLGFREFSEWEDDQAKMVADVLTNSLPQGVMHRVLILLLQEYPQHYIGNDRAVTRRTSELLKWAMEWLNLEYDTEAPGIDPEWMANWKEAMAIAEKAK